MRVSTLSPRRRRLPLALSGAERLFPLLPAFDGLFETLGTELTARTGSPDIDVVENEDAVLVTAELPGVAASDVDIQLTDEGLLLKGEKHAETVEESDQRHVVERTYGKFERWVRLPVDIAEEDVDASFKNGVLTVRLPKAAPAAGPRSISIRSDD